MSTAKKAAPAGVVEPGGALDQIIGAKVQRLAEAKSRVPESALIQELDQRERAPMTFEESLRRAGRPNIISEIKHRSPSRGVIREPFDPAGIAASYQRGGAAAISVLTETDYFGGSLDHLRSVRKASHLPLLRKDFIFDGYQVYEAACAGADAALLIVAMLEDGLLAELIALCGETGIDALVEVHNAEELDRAARAGARIIGVNNRDLRSFEVSLDTSVALAKLAPGQAVLVAESGISAPSDIRRLRSAGYNAFLIGEHFMRAPDPGEALATLIADA
jgi:indole-3-glycerol phosphate synthase